MLRVGLQGLGLPAALSIVSTELSRCVWGPLLSAYHIRLACVCRFIGAQSPQQQQAQQHVPQQQQHQQQLTTAPPSALEQRRGFALAIARKLEGRSYNLRNDVVQGHFDGLADYLIKVVPKWIKFGVAGPPQSNDTHNELTVYTTPETLLPLARLARQAGATAAAAAWLRPAAHQPPVGRQDSTGCCLFASHKHTRRCWQAGCAAALFPSRQCWHRPATSVTSAQAACCTPAPPQVPA
jgi:hypothetical protein